MPREVVKNTRNDLERRLAVVASDIFLDSLLEKKEKNSISKMKSSGIIVSQKTAPLSESEMHFMLDNMLDSQELNDSFQLSMRRLRSRPIRCPFCGADTAKLQSKFCCKADEHLFRDGNFLAVPVEAKTDYVARDKLKLFRKLGSKMKMDRSDEEARKRRNVDGMAKERRLDKLRRIDFFPGMATLRRIKEKLGDCERYCPDVYHYQGNIVELWGSADYEEIERKLKEFEENLV